MEVVITEIMSCIDLNKVETYVLTEERELKILEEILFRSYLVSNELNIFSILV